MYSCDFFFFFQAEDGIRDVAVTGVQTCALPIWDQVVHTLVGSPGVFDTRRGRLLFAPNLPGMGQSGLAEAMRQALGASVTIENDANLAAIGEGAGGHGRDVGTFVFLAIGTGVGMGVVGDG